MFGGSVDSMKGLYTDTVFNMLLGLLLGLEILCIQSGIQTFDSLLTSQILYPNYPRSLYKAL